VPYETLSQLLNESFKIYSKAVLVNTHTDRFGYRMYFSNDCWRYLQSLNYAQFLKTNVLDVETAFVYSFYTDLLDRFQWRSNNSYFPFGPLVSGLNNGIFYISEVSRLFIKIFGGEKAGISFFAKTKHSYNLTGGVFKRLLETIKLVPGLDSVMVEFLKEKFPNEAAVKNSKFIKPEEQEYLFSQEWFSFIEAAKSFLKKRQGEIFINLLDECNNTAIYLPRVAANQVVRQIQRPFNQLAFIGSDKLYNKKLLIDFIGHIPPFVLNVVKSLKESGIMMRIFDLISSTSKPPPTENLRWKETWQSFL